MSDALGSVLSIGAAGAVFASLTARHAAGAAPYLAVDAIMAVMCLLGAAAAVRVRADHTP